jgi:hypothetical protein
MKRKYGGSPHPAVIGFAQMTKTPTNPFSSSGKAGIKELSKQSGMSKTEVYEHIGRKVMKGDRIHTPSKEEQEQEQRLKILQG